MTDHGGPAVAFLALALFAGYELGAWRLRGRGDRWPPVRDVGFGLGIAAAIFPEAPGFTGHVLQHVLVGMLAPLLLVLARPMTLLLRAAPAARRRLKPVLGAWPVAVLVFPPVAAVLEAGSLWLLYRTGLFAATGREPGLHALVHAHVFLTGLLFTTSVCRLDPMRHRSGLGSRAAALVGAAAAHAVLAKTLYRTPPPGTVLAVADRQAGAELMYYGGDVVELGLALVVALSWYAARGRAEARARRRGQPPTWMPGRRAGSFSALRMISRTTGAVSPRPRSR
ncbi:cytochrome c oxidase assembly protein [Amycolatopsis sp. cmx-4-68]|uniref:cytochrome c oxidase assembly protein n=1 Tax=Amycolatopsis sp. cmx-4-68 TaxID=2790938 RepID=UPI00397BC2BD